MNTDDINDNYDNYDDEHIENAQVVPIFTDSLDNDSTVNCSSGDVLPLLPLRNMVLCADSFTPVAIGRKSSLHIVKTAYKEGTEIFVGTQIDAKVDVPTQKDLYPYGVVGKVMKIIELPNNTTTAIISGKHRAKIVNLTIEEKIIKARITLMNDEIADAANKETVALILSLKEVSKNLIKSVTDVPDEMSVALDNIDTLSQLIGFLVTNMPLEIADKIAIIEEDNQIKRGKLLLKQLMADAQFMEIKNDIERKAKMEMNQQQKDFFLQQQVRIIQEELGDATSQDKERLNIKSAKKKWDEATARHFARELKKLDRLHPSSPDYSIQLNYLETIVNLPWGEYSQDNFDLAKAAKILDKHHYGLDKVKERIIEHLAVLKLKDNMKAPILCLYGPPGIGKTSLGKSIAESLGRKYVRMSLGGIHDEAEIRGHRRTYIGAMPGRIIYNLSKAGTSNPVFVLDEIDKMTADIKGDPASAMLEVLDPEQNFAFHDNFLDCDYDLSHVLFIATANNISAIPKPLLDRMELIEVTGYATEEKIAIATKHLVPKQLQEHGLNKSGVTIAKPALEYIINNYTSESGVRELERTIGKIVRKKAVELVQEGTILTPKVKNPQMVKEILKRERYNHDNKEGAQVGVVTGLAWTSVGGEILFVEACTNAVKGGKMTFTGNLGDVMKESAQLALEYVKAHCDDFGLTIDYINDHSIHLHFPEGATPKDGPSAGITILTAIVSALTNKKVKDNIAMSGEITLRGKVLPVGGLKEKVLAAKRAGITEIILCEENRKDIEEIDPKYIEGMNFNYVKSMLEVPRLAIENDK